MQYSYMHGTILCNRSVGYTHRRTLRRLFLREETLPQDLVKATGRGGEYGRNLFQSALHHRSTSFSVIFIHYLLVDMEMPKEKI